VRIKFVRWFEDEGPCLLTFDASWPDSDIYEDITEMLDGEDPDDHGFEVTTDDMSTPELSGSCAL
jgi:hypothetical protein